MRTDRIALVLAVVLLAVSLGLAGLLLSRPSPDRAAIVTYLDARHSEWTAVQWYPAQSVQPDWIPPDFRRYFQDAATADVGIRLVYRVDRGFGRGDLIDEVFFVKNHQVTTTLPTRLVPTMD